MSLSGKKPIFVYETWNLCKQKKLLQFLLTKCPKFIYSIIIYDDDSPYCNDMYNDGPYSNE